eukprot:1850614-Pyramimonas_sp.AAC.1
MPDRAVRDQHRLTHWPFRTWSLFCIAGRGQGGPRALGGPQSPDPAGLHRLLVPRRHRRRPPSRY